MFKSFRVSEELRSTQTLLQAQRTDATYLYKDTFRDTYNKPLYYPYLPKYDLYIRLKL